MLRRELGEAGEVRPGCLRVEAERRHRHQPGDACRGERFDHLRKTAGRDPGLPLLPGDVDLDQDLGARAAALRDLGGRRWRPPPGPSAPAPPPCAPWAPADAVPTEWIRRQAGSSCLTLRLWRLPMKSHSKASFQRSCLAARSCWRFSPTRSTPASANAPISSSGTYLVATRISTPPPARSRARVRFSATFAGSMSWIGSTIVSRLPRAIRPPPGVLCVRRRGGGGRKGSAQ